MITITFFSIYFFVWCPKRLGWRIMGTLILSLDSVQPNILEYTISIQCGCIVHLYSFSHARLSI